MAFCTKCGSQLPDGATFCTTCGAPLAKPAGTPAAPSAPAAPVPQMPQQPPAQPMQQAPRMPQQPQIPQPAQMQQPQQPQMPQQPVMPPQPQMQQPYGQPYPQQFAQPYAYPKPDLTDHTSEFEKDDVKKYKYIAAAIYAVIAGLFFVTNDGLGIVPLFSRLIDNVGVLINGGFAAGAGNFSAVGIFTLVMVAVAAITKSDYMRFHATQGAKLMICTVALFIVRLIPVVGPVIFYVGILAVMAFAIIALIQTISGKSKEPLIISFLK